MTKTLIRILLTIVSLYIAAWVYVGIHFTLTFADKESLEKSLQGSFDGREVSFSKADVKWRAWQLQVRVEDFKVAGDLTDVPALSFKKLSARVNPWSFLLLWPQLEGLALDSPELEIDTTQPGKVRIAGIEMRKSGLKPSNKRRMLQWLLDQKNTAVHNGSVVWRKADGQIQRYSNMNFVFDRQQEMRVVTAGATSVKGSLAINLKMTGDIVEQADWDAELEVLGGGDQPLLGKDDLEVSVIDGVGQLKLKALDVERITDFLALLDMGAQTDLFVDPNIGGRLEDVRFVFSGPLLNLASWNLKATVVDLALRPVASDDRFPRLQGLNGSVEAYSDHGELRFIADDASFEWDRYFDYPFPIALAEGVINWRTLADGRVQVNLNQAQFKDDAVWIKQIGATAHIGNSTERIDSFGELFTVDSISDLEFEKGGVVVPLNGFSPKAMHLDANAEFDVFNVDLLDRYIPTIDQTQKFKTWWVNSFKQGTAKEGVFGFSGSLDKESFRSGAVDMSATAQFEDVVLDYGYQRQWPMVERASGIISLEEGALIVDAQEAYLDGDKIFDPVVRIDNLFRLDRQLEVSGKVSSTFVKATKLILQGPLFEPENRPEVLPVTATKGTVDVDIALSLPLADVDSFSLTGSAVVTDAAMILTGGVPLSQINTNVRFSEDRVESDPMTVAFLGGETQAQLETIEPGKPPKMRLKAQGTMQSPALTPWLGEHLVSRLSGQTDWQGEIIFDVPEVLVLGRSDLLGLAINAPRPLGKRRNQARELNLEMRFGNADMEQNIDIKFADRARVQMRQNADNGNNEERSFFDAAEISLGHLRGNNDKEGVNLNIDSSRVDLDNWIETVIDLASFETVEQTENTDFLDAMRRIDVRSDNPILLGRQFGKFELSATSSDGKYWFGRIDGDRVSGNLQMEPRADLSQFRFDLDKLHLDEVPEEVVDLLPIDRSLSTSNYPSIDITIEDFKVVEMALGRLVFKAGTVGDEWLIDTIILEDQGVVTTGSGSWVNNSELGSFTHIDFDTDIEAADDALDSLDFAGFLRKGDGYAKGRLEWQGAPHEFDYSRLNGDFDLRIQDGELTQVAPGTGRLLGLLNFNALLRRVTFDFSDVLASGLKFDKMHYTGVLAEGEAIMSEAFLLSPAVFVRMEGKIDLDEELIDMEMHVAPELGGNLTLLSALANPTAGALMFVLQNVFKDEMRNSSFISYRAEGNWQDFEFVEIDGDYPELDNSSKQEIETELEELRTISRPQLTELLPVETVENQLNRAD